MNNQWMILALLLGGLFLLRNRPTERDRQMAQPSDLGVIGYRGRGHRLRHRRLGG